MNTIYEIYGNGHSYIGCTSTTLEKRISAHRSRAKRQMYVQSPLYVAFRHHGFDSFKVRELAKIENRSMALAFEAMAIQMKRPTLNVQHNCS